MRNQRISARRKEISLSSISCRRSSRGHERYPVALKQPRVRRISIGNVSRWHMADAFRRCNETVSYLGVTRRARGVPRSRPRRPSLTLNRRERRDFAVLLWFEWNLPTVSYRYCPRSSSRAAVSGTESASASGNGLPLVSGKNGTAINPRT